MRLAKLLCAQQSAVGQRGPPPTLRSPTPCSCSVALRQRRPLLLVPPSPFPRLPFQSSPYGLSVPLLRVDGADAVVCLSLISPSCRMIQRCSGTVPTLGECLLVFAGRRYFRRPQIRTHVDSPVVGRRRQGRRQQSKQVKQQPGALVPTLYTKVNQAQSSLQTHHGPIAGLLRRCPWAPRVRTGARSSQLETSLLPTRVRVHCSIAPEMPSDSEKGQRFVPHVLASVPSAKTKTANEPATPSVATHHPCAHLVVA